MISWHWESMLSPDSLSPRVSTASRDPCLIMNWLPHWSLQSLFFCLSFCVFSQCSSICLLACVLSCVQLFMTPWTVAHQALLSRGFSRQEYWSGLPFTTPRDLPNPGIELVSPASLNISHLLHWQVDPLPLHHLGILVFSGKSFPPLLFFQVQSISIIRGSQVLCGHLKP